MAPPLKHILCIDDEEDILHVLRLALSDIGGFTVTTLTSSADAVARSCVIQPDLILLDVMMPGMDGRTTFAALREQPALANVPMVFMTARVQPHEVDEYLGLGATGVIRKPFDPVRVADEITALWNHYHAHRS